MTTYFHSLIGYTPPARTDHPWTKARIRGTLDPAVTPVEIETVTFTDPDTDPTAPKTRNLQTTLAPFPAGWLDVAFIDAAGVETEASELVYSPATTAGLTTYLSPTELREDPAISDTLADADAARVILAAEDAIDARLGNRTINTTTGRKVDPTDTANVAAWQFAKIKRATLLLAVRFNSRPELAAGRQWQTEKVADVTYSGPLDTNGGSGAAVGVDVQALIDQCRLTVIPSYIF